MSSTIQDLMFWIGSKIALFLVFLAVGIFLFFMWVGEIIEDLQDNGEEPDFYGR